MRARGRAERCLRAHSRAAGGVCAQGGEQSDATEHIAGADTVLPYGQ